MGVIQNTFTNLGASIGTAVAESILIATLTASFLSGIDADPRVPEQVSKQADVQLASGAPFMSDADLEDALGEAGVDQEVAAAIVDANEAARLDALRAALSVLAIAAAIGLLPSRPVPTVAAGESKGL